MKSVGPLILLATFLQACSFFGQNVSTENGPHASFTVDQVSSTEIILDAGDSTSFLDAVDNFPSGYLEYQWSFGDLDGDFITQKIEFAPSGVLSNGDQALILVNGGSLQITEDQDVPHIQYNAPLGGIDTITIPACLQVRDANNNLNVTPAEGLICQDITMVSASIHPSSEFSIGGSISGLTGTVVLQNNGGDSLILMANGAFTFSDLVLNGNGYNVTVLTQPTGQTCTVSDGVGTAIENVGDVNISCVTSTHTIGGLILGLNGTVVLQNNGGDNLVLTADGNYTFATTLSYGDAYAVTVLTQPATQTCVVSGDSGFANADVTDVNISCVTNTFDVGGNVSGLTGTLILENNGGNDETITINGSYTFDTSINDGDTYAVTIEVQPAGQTCSVFNDSGTVSGADITNVDIVCLDNEYSIGGTVAGLTGTVVLQNNAGDDETILADGVYTFDTEVPESGAYLVTVLTQPAGQFCTVSNGVGTAITDVTNVNITCQNSYTLGGTFTGIPSGSDAALIDNESGQTILINGNVSSTGLFTFAASYLETENFDLSVQSKTSTLACTLVNQTGTFSATNVSNVELNCATALCSPVESKYKKHCSPTASDAAGGANMVAVSSDFVVVATNLDDANSDTAPSNNALADSGAVFVYQRDDLSGNWIAVDFLKASNLQTTDWFGYSVALDGVNKRIIVGARQEDSNSAAAPANNALSAAGASYIFERDSTGNWVQVAYLKHPSPTATDNCGTSVAIDGDYAVMGCPDEDSNTDTNPANNGASASGCAVVYQRSGVGVWSQFDFLKASNLGNTDQFGADVAISGDYIMIGSPAEDSNTDVLPGNNVTANSGAAYIFRYDGVSNWAQEDFLKASNLEASDNFGASVDVTEEGYAIVGARNEDSVSQATPADNTASASGAAYIYERDGLGNWAQTNYLKHTSPTASDLFGIEVSISGNYAIVGAQSEDSDGPYATNESSSASGAAFVFERSVGIWGLDQFLKAFNQDVSDLFGTSVNISEDQLIIGATGEDSSGTSPFNETVSASGAGYVYELDGGWLGD